MQASRRWGQGHVLTAHLYQPHFHTSTAAIHHQPQELAKFEIDSRNIVINQVIFPEEGGRACAVYRSAFFAAGAHACCCASCEVCCHGLDACSCTTQPGCGGRGSLLGGIRSRLVAVAVAVALHLCCGLACQPCCPACCSHSLHPQWALRGCWRHACACSKSTWTNSTTCMRCDVGWGALAKPAQRCCYCSSEHGTHLLLLLLVCGSTAAAPFCCVQAKVKAKASRPCLPAGLPHRQAAAAGRGGALGWLSSWHQQPATVDHAPMPNYCVKAGIP